MDVKIKLKNSGYIVMVLVLTSFFGCDRTFEMDAVSVTPPELHVYANAQNGPAAGATIHLYRAASDRDNEANAIIKTADGSGLAIFENAELAHPGIFYLSAEFEGTVVQSETPYLLLNDGHTRFEIEF